MILSIASIIAGFMLLVWGADRFVVGSAATAKNLGVSPLVIGLTIVGFGTSAPEIMVAAVAAWQGNPGLAIGNAIGSNIANIALILGITAIVVPLHVRSETLKREFPVLLAITLFAMLLLIDLYLSRWDGALLLLGLVTMLYWLIGIAKQPRAGDPIAGEYAEELSGQLKMGQALMWCGVGLAILLIGSRLLVWGAVNVATALGVSDLIIGLTIVAIGTSLPELATSIVSALKREHDIAIGNIIGSNMYNLLAVLSIPGLLHPIALDEAVLMRDSLTMVGLTLALFAMAYGFSQDGRINRFEGAILLGAFIVYQSVLFNAA